MAHCSRALEYFFPTRIECRFQKYGIFEPMLIKSAFPAMYLDIMTLFSLIFFPCTFKIHRLKKMGTVEKPKAPKKY